MRHRKQRCLRRQTITERTEAARVKNDKVDSAGKSQQLTDINRR